MIEQVTNLNLKSFKNYTGPTNKFVQANIIFGYNGRGKSTLAEGIVKEFLKVDGNEIGLTDAMVNAGFVPSKAEAKRMVKGNGVKVNGKVVSDVQLTLDPKENPVIQVGKNKFIKLV